MNRDDLPAVSAGVKPGDIARASVSTSGHKVRVIRVEASGLVIAEDVEHGVVSRFDADTLKVVEPWPGGVGS